MKKTYALTGLTLLALTGPLGASETGRDWQYSGTAGPDHWGRLQPDYAPCAQGRQQSPIDITTAEPISSLTPIRFSYQPAAAEVVDNGHTVEAMLNGGGGITLGRQSYELVQFHFHTPSEHQFNGKAAPMVVHLVHRNAEGQLAVVDVSIQEGAAHPLLDRLWQVLPPAAGPAMREEAALDANLLLPAQRDYFTYSGSLTTPPCSEGVRWLVLKEPITASSAQIATYAARHPDSARPVQPLHGRVVIAD